MTLISLMIGKLGMSVDECIDEYEALSAIIFREGRHLRGKLTAGIVKERYSGEVLSREIASLFTRRGRNANELMATSNLLPPNEFAHSSVVYGGLGCNNPTVRAWFHYRKSESHGELGWRGSLLISLGTGLYDQNTYHPPKRTRLQKVVHIPAAIQLMKDATTDPEDSDELMRLLAITDGVNIDYYRFSATTGVCWIKMDDYKKLDYIKSQTEEYLNLQQVRRQLRNCAVELAQGYIRRLESVNENGPAHGL
ncbi:hypothetical protein GP486_006639 [Trichoglossum hirsutum]|uniref:PNPLA domain-containing protein n=1 Tax=Trichoglossum hirsutum TaxID=265104 RepID=A0A9P8IIF5_9PEZI|nr:hypothetical protein GP486_006639 [Trichoglossum hirsutum]